MTKRIEEWSRSASEFPSVIIALSQFQQSCGLLKFAKQKKPLQRAFSKGTTMQASSGLKAWPLAWLYLKRRFNQLNYAADNAGKI